MPQATERVMQEEEVEGDVSEGEIFWRANRNRESTYREID